jgi:regulator of sirC expression with transglutaminase-like and TPR domain
MQATSIKISWRSPQAHNAAPSDVAGIVDAILSAPDEDRLDYTAAKLAFDKLIDDTTDTAEALATIERMTIAAQQLAGPLAGPNARLVALRRLLYEAGSWNGNRPFAYDHTDPLGQSIPNKLIATYLATRRGNCVSMPCLFLILADRLDLSVTFSTAPLHIFTRYTDEEGLTFNIEPTNGGQAFRDAWYVERMQISDRAVASGLYLRSLSRRENVALMATTVLEHLLEQRRFPEALALSEVILRHAPLDGYTMVIQATVCGEMLRDEFERKYRTPAEIPKPLMARYQRLAQRNRAGFEAAEALGWEPVE